MSRLEETCARIHPLDRGMWEAVQARLDRKTKPRRSLGRLEDLACQVAAIQGTTAPTLRRKAIVVMAADHGVAEDGVSAYPQAVTTQMLLNFARGGAAINALARHAGAEVVVVDIGAKDPPPPTPAIRSCRIGPGTRNFTRGPAMNREEALRAVETGIQIAEELSQDDAGLVGMGEMGIGNTTAASAVTAALSRADPEAVTGQGTGIDEAGLRRKIQAIRRALSINTPDPGDPLDVLAKVGGFEIGGLAGVALGCAAHRVPVVVDGFIASVAAWLAARLVPALPGFLIPSHASVEPGHRVVLEALGLKPLLNLEMRLGEGTGAALALGLVEAALRILHDMATFEAAKVTDTGR